MQVIHLRHSIRSNNEKHLNQEGINLARKMGKKYNEFDLVISSISQRCIETAVAIGYTINQTIDFSDADQLISKTNPNFIGTTYQEYFIEYSKNEYL
ncbi:MAG: histidine phosphatase family protein [Candidatus Heimdallarchaeota archaeon]|nr:histidine phosphatase family protein [Candidatus Heimdallarchaeota archaeon]MDH5644851.1 histidine phosphatase family protein [Candidatus Heimdallarchaeota archaeon]